MPVRHAKNVPDYPNKRPRLDTTSSKPKLTFTNASQIRASLKNEDPEALAEALTSLRNQLTVKPQETHISPQDERLALVKLWMESSPGAQDLFTIWDKSSSNSRPTPITPLILSILSSLLSLLSVHYSNHPLGQPIMKTLLAPARLRQLNSFLGGANNEVIIVTLKLFNSMSDWAGGRERKGVLEGFGWEIKSLPKLLNMRRKTHGERDTTDPLIRPDIRTLYILLLLSFIDPTTPSQTKTLFLEQHRDAFLGIFKGLQHDHYSLARKILEVCWAGLWGDAKVKRTVKVGLFGEATLGHLVKLYDRTTAEDAEEDHVPANLVHHFLLAICTRPGTGICFKDRGWYPREADADDLTLHSREKETEDVEAGWAGTRGRGGRIYNKILANFVKTLKVNEDSRQQELVLKILGACPELVAGYWSAVALTLEPRLSSKWITNIAVFGSIISLPVPSWSFLLPSSSTSANPNPNPNPKDHPQTPPTPTQQYNPTPPPLSTILENILPSSTSPKHNFTKGLQSPSSALVQHCTALALCRCLLKYDSVVREMKGVSEALEEDEEEGQWARRIREVEREVRRRVPDWGVCVGFAVAMGAGAGLKQQEVQQQQQPAGKDGQGNAALKQNRTQTLAQNPTKMALLAESAQRLLWLYHRCLPAVVAEVRFDVGKLLQAFVQGPSAGAGAGVDSAGEDEEGEEEEHEPDASSRLYRVQQLHILELLKESDQFVWSSKIPSLSQTPFHVLLTALSSRTASSSVPAIQNGITAVLQRILSQSILFQEDADEPELWLRALPRTRRVVAGESSNELFQRQFEGEAEGVISFLDDCVQRCLKTPYKYVEALHALVNTSFASSSASTSTPNVSGAAAPIQPLALDLKQLPSPLLMTLLEQLEAKINNSLLGPSHVVGVAAYVRKLFFGLASKTSSEEGLKLLRVLAGKVDGVLSVERVRGLDLGLDSGREAGKEKGLFVGTVRREVEMMRACLSFALDLATEVVVSESSHPDVEAYLDAVDQLPIPHTKRLRNAQAQGLIDWIRSSQHPLRTPDLARVTKRVIELEPSLLPTVVENLVPGQADLWEALDIASRFSDLRPYLDFLYLFLHTTSKHILNERCQSVLSQSMFASRQPGLVDIVRSINLITHRLSAVRQQVLKDDNVDSLAKSLLFILSRILEASKEVLSAEDMMTLKESVFARSGVIKDVMMEPASAGVVEGIQRLVDSSLDSASAGDRVLVSEISSYWFNALTQGLDNSSPESVSSACLWIKFLPPTRLFDLLDFLQKDAQNMPSVSVWQPINVILEALCSTTSSDWEAETMLLERLPQLLSLRSIMPDSALLEQVLAIAVEASLPIGLDGCSPLASAIGDSLSNLTKRAEGRWLRRHQSGKVDLDLDIRSFLMQPTYSSWTVKIICGLIYRQSYSYSPDVLLDWVQSPHCFQRSAEHLLPIVHAFLDSLDAESKASSDPEMWSPFIPVIVRTLADQDVALDQQRYAQSSLMEIVSSSSVGLDAVLGVLAKEVQALPEKQVTPQLLSAGANLTVKLGSKANPILSILIDRGIESCIDQFGDVLETLEATTLAEALTSLLRHAPVAKAHLVETLLTVVIQSRFSNVVALHLATVCLSTCQLKPVVVNRHLQSIVQHPYFFKISSSSLPEHVEARDALIELLHRLFNLHPTNTCQVTHIEPLIKVYKGTLSSSDLRIFSLFQLFESQRKLSVTPLLSRWSANVNTSSQTALEALQSLDPILVLRTCLNFPRWRRLEDQSSISVSAQEAVLYDPVFLMLLFSQMVSEQPPSSAFGWIELFRTNVVSLFIRALSARDGQMRDLALSQVVALWRQMDTADLQEKPHVVHILNLLKDLMPSPVPSDSATSDPVYPRRLPTYTTLLLMHSLRAVFHPSNFIYPITARFLLQRPSLDVSDVPMLYALLYSSSDENWKKERAWIIKFLADGMVGSEDWRVLKRRHTWDLLASLFQSVHEGKDGALRMGILEVLANLTCNAQATMSLILKSALLQWIEIQLLYSTTKTEGIEWIKILENIIVIVEASKIEAATNGEWRSIICRCLGYLLDEKSCHTASDNLPHAVPVILRLASLAGPPLRDLPSLLDLAVACLEKLESSIQISDLRAGPSAKEQQVILSPPHRSLTLHQRVSDTRSSRPLNQALLFVTLLEILWKASMLMQATSNAWEKLTPRMLLWAKASSTADKSRILDVAEWARKEVTRNLKIRSF